MALAADLEILLGRLAAMSPGDREFVLAELGPEAEVRLLPLLEQLGDIRISDGLQARIAETADDLVPAGMTTRSAAALRRAAGEAGKRKRTPDQSANAAPGGSLLARMLRLAGPGR